MKNTYLTCKTCFFSPAALRVYNGMYFCGKHVSEIAKNTHQMSKNTYRQHVETLKKTLVRSCLKLIVILASVFQEVYRLKEIWE